MEFIVCPISFVELKNKLKKLESSLNLGRDLQICLSQQEAVSGT